MIVDIPFHRLFRQFGHNPDIDFGTLPEDIWDGPTPVYPFPTAVAATTIESDSAEDEEGQTGAVAVIIEGLDEDLREIGQRIILAGTTPVPLDVDLLRVNRLFIDGDTGGADSNVGTITIKHGATVIGNITPGRGSSMAAIYTTPRNIIGQSLASYFFALTTQFAASLEVVANFKPATQIAGWRTFEIQGSTSQGASAFQFSFGINGLTIPRGLDIRLRVTASTDNNVPISAGFVLLRMARNDDG